MKFVIPKLSRLAVLVAIVTAGLGVPGAQATLFVDQLTTAQSVNNNGGSVGDTDTSSVAAPEALGGERDLLLTLLVTSGLVGQNAVIGFGEVAYSTSTGERGTLLIAYDGPDGDATTIDTDGLGADGAGIDLTEGGVNTLFAFTATSDLTATITITVWSDGGANMASQSVNLPGGGAMIDYFIPFSSFVGVDFTDVSALSILLGGTTNGGTDISMSPLRATNPVPEPASLTLLGAGLAGLGWMRRRRRH